MRSNWNLEMLIFEERGKPENPEENLSEQSKEPTFNLTHSWPESGPRRWEASAISTTPSLLLRKSSEIYISKLGSQSTSHTDSDISSGRAEAAGQVVYMTKNLLPFQNTVRSAAQHSPP